MTGLVIFGVAYAHPVQAAKAKPEPASTEEIKTGPIDWAEYGRIASGEVSLALTVGAPLKANSYQIPLTLNFENRSVRDVNLFKVDTGEGGNLFNPILSVTHNGTAVRYQGQMAKIAPSEEWYVPLKPGASFSNTIELIKYYPMVLKTGDVVIIKYDRYDGLIPAELSLTVE